MEGSYAIETGINNLFCLVVDRSHWYAYLMIEEFFCFLLTMKAVYYEMKLGQFPQFNYSWQELTN